jgi:hypothetical protein
MKNIQKGFGVLVVILALVVMSLIAVVTLFISNNSNKTKTEANTIITEPQTYLNIKELGLKLKLTPDTKDLTYYLDPQNKIVLSSASLAAEEPMCAADYVGESFVHGVGTILYYTDPDNKDLSPDGTLKNSELFLDPLQLGDKYYYLWSQQSFCVNNGTHNKESDKAYQIEDSLVKAIRRHEIKIEKL